MAVQTILPETNLTYTDIRDTLNAGGGVVTNEVATAFKSTAKINKWSAHKPIVRPVNFIEGADTKLPTGTGTTSEWWKYNACGLELPMNKAVYGAKGNGTLYIGWLAQTAFKSGTQAIPDYTYSLPQGGAEEPMRLGDFRKYNPNAAPLFKTEIIGYEGGENHLYNFANTQKLKVYMSWDHSNREISLSDLMGSTGSYYYLYAEVYLRPNAESTITDLSSINPTKVIKSTYNADTDENTNYGKILEIDIPSIVAEAGMTNSSAQGKHMYIVIGLNYFTGSLHEQSALIMPRTEGNGYYYRFELYYEYMRKVEPVSAYLYSGTTIPTEYEFGSGYPASFTSVATQFGVKVKCERDTTKGYYVVGNNTTAPNGEEGVQFRFVPTGAVNARKAMAEVWALQSDGVTWGAAPNDRTYIPIASKKDEYTEVYLMFNDVYDGRDSKVVSGYIEASNDGGNTWDALEGASVTLNINK